MSWGNEGPTNLPVMAPGENVTHHHQAASIVWRGVLQVLRIDLGRWSA